MQLLRSWFQWQHKFTDLVFTNSGLAFQYLAPNGSWSLEPRFGFNWILKEKHTISFGAGLYSQMQPKVFYYVLAPLPDGTYIQTNNDLDFTRSIQLAAGYNYLITKDFRLKTDIYYQYLYDIPVKSEIPEYAILN